MPPPDDSVWRLPPQRFLLSELFQHPGPGGCQCFPHLLRDTVSSHNIPFPCCMFNFGVFFLTPVTFKLHVLALFSFKMGQVLSMTYISVLYYPMDQLALFLFKITQMKLSRGKVTKRSTHLLPLSTLHFITFQFRPLCNVY